MAYGGMAEMYKAFCWWRSHQNCTEGEYWAALQQICKERTMGLEEKIARMMGESDHEYPYAAFPGGWHDLARKVIAAVREHDKPKIASGFDGTFE